jgi:serine/threonine protein kinase
VRDLQRNRFFARKIIRLDDEGIENEIRTMKQLCTTGHENIVQVYQQDVLRLTTFYFIDMELCDINLDEYLQGRRDLHSLFEWKIAEGHGPFLTYTILQEILAGLIFIHDSEDAHMNLHPRNGNL